MLQDLRFAIRMLVKDRWFTFVAVLALGLGIGVNTTVFTFVNAVLIRGLPYDDSERIMIVTTRNTTQSNPGVASYQDLEDWRAQSKSFTGLACFQQTSMNVTDSGHPPERTPGARVCANTFGLLGQPMHLGRDFLPGEDKKGAEPVVIIGYGVWKSRYGGDSNILGRAVKVNGVAATIVGVMPEGVRFPSNADMWQPLVPNENSLRRNQRNMTVVGRLAPGVTQARAQAEMSGIAQQLAKQFPDTNENIDALVMTFNQRFNGGPIRIVFLALLGAVGFVLLIACANVANLQLARSAQRAREVAVRVALGASRARVVRQLLVESTLLACIGGVLGLGLSTIGVRLFDRAVEGSGKPYWIQFTFDPIVFGYLALICLTTGILFGLAPALQVSKTNVNEILKEGGRGSAGGRRARWLTSTMVVVELALTIVLLVGAGLMIRSFLKLYSLDIGARTDHLLTMSTGLPDQKYPKAEQRQIFYESVLTRLQTIPGMQAAAIASAIPFGGSDRRRLEIDGKPVAAETQKPSVAYIAISPRYFDVVAAPVRRGRGFTETDGGAGAEVALVNERFAAQHFPNEDPVGRRIRLLTGDGRTPPPASPSTPPPPEPKWLTIVGISPTIRQGDRQALEPDAVVYVPYRLESYSFMNILTRSQVEPGALTMQVRQTVQAIDPELPVFGVQTMDQFLSQARWPYRVFGSMFAIFAVIALVLSAVGIYAVTAYSVTQRTQEIGVRMALGARGGQVSWLILRQGLVQLAIGLAIGLAGALPLSGVLQTLVIQIPTKDPVTFTAIAGILVAVTIAACLIPARRATRLDPLVALRAE
ncbi:MAG: ABC transporter permease [Vicinamibacterales bacterium]